MSNDLIEHTASSSAARGPDRAARARATLALDETGAQWASWTLWAIAAATLLRWLINGQTPMALHFDEAQYWTYGEELALGYYSKPPLAAWLIRASTDLFGDTIPAVRAWSPLLHGWIAWLVFATARRLFEARTGFWAAILYLSLPGVTASAGVMTTDPAMMAAWAAALYALVRALDAEDAPGAGAAWPWWVATGAAIGAGLLAKYTMIGFVGGALGYALLSRQGSWGARRTDWLGPVLALWAAVLVFAPNLYWNAQNDFAAIAHVGDNAKLGEGVRWNFDKAIEFLGAQAAIFGPVAFAAAAAMAFATGWRREWEYRLLMWLTLPLPILMTAQAFLSRAHPNWAAPAYIAAAIVVAAWLLDRDRRAWLVASVAIGVVAFVGFWGAGFYYKANHETSLRVADPFKKMRELPPICGRAMDGLAMGEIVLATDRRLLAVCMFEAKIGTDRIAIWAPRGRPGNHYQLTSSLQDGDEGPFLLVIRGDDAALERVAAQFRTVAPVDAGRIRTHADREIEYRIARVSGFNGYPPR